MLKAVSRYGARESPRASEVIEACRQRGELVQGPQIEKFEQAFALRHMVFLPNFSSTVRASLRSGESNPSVNQLKIGSSRSRASACLPSSYHRQARLVAARNEAKRTGKPNGQRA